MKTSNGITSHVRILKEVIDTHGFDEKDRLGRKVRALPGHFYVLKDEDLALFRELKVLEKYVDDEDRMRPDLAWCSKRAKIEPNSRQLIVHNNTGVRNVPACFNMVQFSMTHRKQYDMYVYQRSSDLAKWQDDISFFIRIKDLFEKWSGKKCTKIVIVYGNIHYNKKSPPDLELGK